MVSTSSPLFAATGLTRRFGGLLAIDSLDLSVSQGEIRALIGPNGAGKTTFLNLVTGVYRPSAGEISFEGERLTGMRPSAIVGAGVARTFQHPALFEGMNVRDNVAVAGFGHLPKGSFWEMFRLSPSARTLDRAREDAMQWLDFVGLASKATSDPRGLAPAERRLLELARAMTTKPRLLLLDEPFAGMTLEEAGGIFEKLEHLRSQGVTIILIDHNMRLVMKLADLVTVISFGRKIGEGRPADVRASQAVVEAYLGAEHVAAVA